MTEASEEVAHVQYDHWVGTFAGDEVDPNTSLGELLGVDPAEWWVIEVEARSERRFAADQGLGSF